MDLPVLGLLIGMLYLSSTQAQLGRLSGLNLTPRATQQIGGALFNVQRCMLSTGATSDDLQTLRRQEVPTSRSGKCFVACMGKEYGVLRGSQVNEARAQQLLTEVLQTVTENVSLDPNLTADVQAEVSNLIQVCGYQGAANSNLDECELAATIAQCAFQEGRGIRARLRQRYGSSRSRG